MQEDDRALSLAELAKLVADRFGSELADSPENLIGSEVDSLLLVEIVLVVEQLGVRIQDQWLDDILDFSDLHHYYVQAWNEGRVGANRTFEHPLMGRSALLRPILPQDVGPLYVGLQEPSVAQTWRFRSRTPSPEAFQAALWDGVFLQYVVCSPRNPEPLGLVTAFNEDRGARHCEIGLAMTSVFHNRRMATEAAILFINHLFVEFDLRKVYIETLDITAERLGLARHELIHQEGRKLGHERIAGNLHDTLLFAIYQPEWRSALQRGLPGLVAGTSPLDEDG